MNIDMDSSFVDFRSKARSLRALGEVVRCARVLPSFIFNVDEWSRNSDYVLARIPPLLQSSLYIVRSSSSLEGFGETSNAGRFLTVLNVQPAALSDAINAVIKSYGPTCKPFDEVFVQPMVTKLRYSGVAATRDQESGLPYVIVNITKGESSDLVTSGHSECHGSVYISPTRPSSQHSYSCIFSLLDELDLILGGIPIEVEFGVDQDDVILFQVRPLPEVPTAQVKHASALKQVDYAHAQLLKLRARFPHEPFAMSVMADWNPAEMIGLKPRALAYDLYSHLITASAWAAGRVPFGYRKMTHRPLMYRLLGSPYIHVPSSILSLLPADLPEAITRSVLFGSLDMLRAEPHLHDKVEFRLIPSCVTPAMFQDRTSCCPPFLSAVEWDKLIEALIPVTATVIDPLGPTSTAFRILGKIQHYVVSLNTRPCSPSNFSTLLTLGSKHAAPAFSGLARAAFVFTAILKSLENLGIADPGLMEAVIGGAQTITSQMRADATRLAPHDFLALYGHLRPGTYDIRSLSYAEAACTYFTSTEGKVDQVRHEPRELSVQEIRAIESYLGAMCLPYTASQFVSLARRIIAGRERAKFIYSGIVSHLLGKVEMAGRSSGLSRDDMSLLQLSEVPILIAGGATAQRLLHVTNMRREMWELDCKMRVPYVVFDTTRFDGFDEFVCQPSFVSTRDVVSLVICLDGREPSLPELCQGKLVLVEAADPGYDWIFSAGASGLVTAFGGENSHMTVRAREFGLPAAIGIGKAKFDTLRKSKVLRLNCAERVLEIVE